MAPYIMEEYIKACKAGKRDYQARMMKGQLPTLQVLDEILPPKGSYSEVPLGLVQIPIDQIVGTKSGGRSKGVCDHGHRARIVFREGVRSHTSFL